MGKFLSGLSSKLATEMTNFILGKGEYRREKTVGALKKSNLSNSLSDENELIINTQHQLGDQYLKDGNMALAVEAFSEAVKIDPNNEWIYNSRAVSYSSLREYELALDDINRAIEINPACAFFYSNRAQYHAMVGNIDQSIADVNRANKICPDEDYNELLQMISSTNQAWELLKKSAECQQEGRIDEAILFCSQADNFNPFLVAAKNMRGSLYYQLNKIDEAILDHTNVKTLRPKHVDAYFALGNLYFAKNDFERAILEYDEALEIKPNHAESYYNRGLAYFNMKSYAKTWDDMRKAEALGLALNPEFIKELNNVYPSNNS